MTLELLMQDNYKSGLAKGLAKGLAEGEKKGEKKAQAQAKKKEAHNVKNLYSHGVSIETIATSFSSEAEVKSILSTK